MKYKVAVEVLNIIECEAETEEQAIKNVRDNLVASKQIKECDPVKIYVVEGKEL